MKYKLKVKHTQIVDWHVKGIFLADTVEKCEQALRMVQKRREQSASA